MNSKDFMSLKMEKFGLSFVCGNSMVMNWVKASISGMILRIGTAECPKNPLRKQVTSRIMQYFCLIYWLIYIDLLMTFG